MLQCGTSSIDITPKEPLELAGYKKSRGKTTFSDVKDPLLASCFYFNKDKFSCLLINADLIWFSDEFCDLARIEIAKQFKLDKEQILFAATHTHSSPQLLGRAHYYGKPNSRYTNFLKNKILLCVKESISQAKSCKVKYASIPINTLPIVNRIQFGYNRFRINKTSFASPNPDRPIDHKLRCIYIMNKDNTLNGILYNTSVHPVFQKSNSVSADFPGMVRSALREVFGSKLTVGFLQGYAGDLRPDFRNNSIIEKIKNWIRYQKYVPKFQKDISKEMLSFGKKLADIIQESETQSKNLIGLSSNKASKETYLSLFDEEPALKLFLQRIDLFESVSIVAVNGEIFSEYLTIIRKIEQRTGQTIIPVGYANGMIGYLPDKDVLKLKSGYEYESWNNFGLPKPISDKFPKLFEKGLSELFSTSLAQ